MMNRFRMSKLQTYLNVWWKGCPFWTFVVVILMPLVVFVLHVYMTSVTSGANTSFCVIFWEDEVHFILICTFFVLSVHLDLTVPITDVYKSLLKYLCFIGIKCCYWNETFYINSLNLVWQFHISQGLYNRVIISYLFTRRLKMLHATCS
jgi:hypothetical protein